MQISLHYKTAFDSEDFDFAKSVFCGKHGKPLALFWAWKAFASLLSLAPGNKLVILCALVSFI